MSRAMVIKDTDRGWKKLRRTLALKRPRYVDVGVLTKHDARSDDVTNTMLAMIHEFGIGPIPSRSFIRDTIDIEKQEIVHFIRKLAERVVTNTISKRVALTLLGAMVEASMKGRVSAGLTPPLKESTIVRKGSSKPLIDTGQLISSLDYEVG